MLTLRLLLVITSHDKPSSADKPASADDGGHSNGPTEKEADENALMATVGQAPK